MVRRFRADAPVDPDGSHRHLHNVDNDSNGQRKPEFKAFYEAIAGPGATGGAEKILILGSAMDPTTRWNICWPISRQYHPQIAGRVVGSVVVNEQHMTDDQLLARAKVLRVERVDLSECLLICETRLKSGGRQFCLLLQEADTASGVGRGGFWGNVEVGGGGFLSRNLGCV